MTQRSMVHAGLTSALCDDMPLEQPPGSLESGIPAAWGNRKASERARRASEARAASSRRRRIDPTTCDRDYSTAELEFMKAMQEYKQSSGRMYPTWSEVLEVLVALGYEKGSPAPRLHG